MGITLVRLDGQTLGLQLDGASPSVDVLSLDISTGVITSSYLTPVDRQNLKATVDELFALVPPPFRAAGALNLLSKMAAVSSADASTVTLSAVNTAGTTYALRATPSVVPANLVAILPYTPNGAIAPGSGSGGGGGGGVTNVTATAPIASSGGATPNITFTVAPGLAGNVLTSTGAAWTSAAPAAIPSVTLQYQLFVAKNGSDLTGDGSLSKPYLTISRALTDANAGAPNDYYRINVSPGTYTENITITKQRILIVGASTQPEQFQTILQNAGANYTVTITPSASTSKFDDVIGLSGLFIKNSSPSWGSVYISTNQLFGVVIDNCYLTTTATTSVPLFAEPTHPSRPRIVVRNTIITVQAAGYSMPGIVHFLRGDVQFDTVRVYGSVAGSCAGVSLVNDATLFADRLIIDKSTNGACVDVNVSTASIGLILTNSSLTSQYNGALPAPCLNINNAVGVACYLWQSVLTTYDLTANNAVDGTFNGVTTPLIYGNLAFSPGPAGINSTIAAAVNASKVAMTVIP